MLWRFDPKEVKSIDLRNAAAGDIVCQLRAAAPPVLWLRLAGDERTHPILHLSGPNALTVWQVQSQLNMPTLLIAKGSSLQLEVAGQRAVNHREGRPGELVFTDDAAYFVAKLDSRGFPEECYISLADWSINAPHQLTPFNASFSAWRLVQVRSAEDREVLFSTGDWSNLAF